jgi:hypothetical protein
MRRDLQEAFQVDALVMSNKHGMLPFVDIQVQGKPRVQGRACLTQQSDVPMIYDLTGLLKTSFQRAVKDAFTDLEIHASPLFVVGQPIKSILVFGVATSMAEDIDNLLKFLLNALYKIVYANNHMMQKVVLVK